MKEKPYPILEGQRYADPNLSYSGVLTREEAFSLSATMCNYLISSVSVLRIMAVILRQEDFI